MRAARFVLGLALLTTPVVDGLAQLRCDSPGIRGVASIRTEGHTFLAVWTQTQQENHLDIFDGPQCSDSTRVASFRDAGVWWQSLAAIGDGAVLGFQVRTTAGEGWYGATKLFLYSGKQFKTSFDSGEICEVTDLDGDGAPEVLEFLTNKANLSSKVRVHTWSGDRFHVLTTVRVSQLYSAKLRARLRSKILASPRLPGHN